MNELPPRVLRYGKNEPLPDRRLLRAGPVTAVFEAGDLRYVKLGDREIVRRVYVAVRDQNWDTILPRLRHLKIDQAEKSFRVTFDCEHRRGAIDFFWTGTMTGDERGTITCVMDGEARSTFPRNRIGFCVLHPIDGCAGEPFVALKEDGTVENGRFPLYISPHQPVQDLRAISHDVLPGVAVEVRFAGEVFEMEDQRNWTDASFKTYGTPLRLPIPVEVQQGAKLQQSVTLTLRGHPSVVLTATKQPTITVAPRPIGRLPRIGLGVASHGRPLGHREIARVRALNLSHLRVDLRLARPDYRDRLRQAVTEANALGIPLEVALFLDAAADEELNSLIAALAATRPPVARWLVFHRDERSTSERWVRLARVYLGRHDPSAVIGAGTDQYFTDINRVRPPVSALDLVCYSLNPQVHAVDNSSLIETLRGQAETARSARQFVGALPLAVSPITLKPRYNPDASGPPSPPRAGELPTAVDARQMSLFGAVWTVGSLKYLADSGVASATYYETTGWQGVMETANGSPLPEVFRSIPGAVFPLYHVLADVGEFADGDVLPLVSSDPLQVDGLAVRRGGTTRVIVANLGPDTRSVRLAGLPAPVRVKRLDETNAVQAMVSPEEYRGEDGEATECVGGEIELSLRPYAVVRIDGRI